MHRSTITEHKGQYWAGGPLFGIGPGPSLRPHTLVACLWPHTLVEGALFGIGPGAQFTCFTSTKVQIPTHKALH